MKHLSQIDSSINFIEEELTGFLESRYVRKVPKYFICYLSSQSGCNHGCRFCHLTVTKQTKFEDALPIDYYTQASKVLKHYKNDDPAEYIHYNFMARGEALANKHILENADTILYELGRLATSFDNHLSVRFNVSTIMPKALDRPLEKIFKTIHPTIYYSLYSVNDSFRKKWMPQAMDVFEALKMLKKYQIFSKKTLKIHHCFIKDENDSEEDVDDMLMVLNELGIEDVEFNLVRYNPYSEIQGVESDRIERNMEIIGKRFKSKIIPRVGFDVNASCGMFHRRS